MDEFMAAAIAQAKQGLREGGIPIGSVLVKDGQIIGRGYNKRGLFLVVSSKMLLLLAGGPGQFAGRYFLIGPR